MLESHNIKSGHHRKVVCTRPPEPSDTGTADTHHIRLYYCPVYTYQWVTPSRETFNYVLLNSASSAWVFTSKRGVEGWWRVWNDWVNGYLNAEKSTRNSRLSGSKKSSAPKAAGRNTTIRMGAIPPVYVVGEQTGNAFRNRFPDVDLRLADDPDGAALARQIIRDGIPSIIHFCATHRREELAQLCRDHGMKVTEVEIYRRMEITKPEPLAHKVDAILFFSPDGVKGFYRLYGLPKGDWKAIAIGHTTAEAVKRVTGRTPKIASSPSFEEMIRLSAEF